MVGALESDGGFVDDEEDECGGKCGDCSECHLGDEIGEGPGKPLVGFPLLVSIIIFLLCRHDDGRWIIR